MYISVYSRVDQVMTEVQESPLDKLLLCEAPWNLGALPYHPLQEI